MGKVSKKNKHLSSEAEIPDSLSRKSQPKPFTFRYWDWEANGEFATASRSHPWRRSRPDRREHGGKWMWGGEGRGASVLFPLASWFKRKQAFFCFLQSVFFINGSFEGMLLVVRVLQCLHGEPAVEVSVFGSTWIQLLRESTTLTFYTCFFSPAKYVG